MRACAVLLLLALLSACKTDLYTKRTEAEANDMVAALRLAGVPVLDQVVTDFRDDDRFGREAAEARALGYAGKLCIHPGQVALATAAFVPSAAEVDRATRLLAAYAAASATAGCNFTTSSTSNDEMFSPRRRMFSARRPTK